MLVYLARPIDSAGTADPNARHLLNQLVETVTATTLVAEMDAVLFRPDSAYAWPNAESQPVAVAGAVVDRINRHAIAECDLLVAVLVRGVPSLGTPAEVEYALSINTPVVVVCDQSTGSGSVQIMAWRARGARIVPLSLSNDQRHLAENKHEVRAAAVAAAMNRNRPRIDLAPAVGRLVDPTEQANRDKIAALPDGTLRIDLSTPDGLAALRKAARVEGWTMGDAVFGPRDEPTARPEVLLVTEADVPEQYLDLTTDFGLGRAYDDDAGFDLSAIGDYEIGPGRRASIQAQVRIAPPPDHWALILGRSSTWSKLGLMTIPGVIDTGWRGALYVQVFNLGVQTVTVKHNQRIGQLILLPTWQGRVERTTQLPEHKRGTNGFGSSGE